MSISYSAWLYNIRSVIFPHGKTEKWLVCGCMCVCDNLVTKYSFLSVRDHYFYTHLNVGNLCKMYTCYRLPSLYCVFTVLLIDTKIKIDCSTLFNCQDRNKKDKTIHCSLLFCIHWLYLKANFDVLISDRGWDPEVFRCRCDRSHTTRHSHNGRWVRQLTSSLLKYTHATFSWCKSPFVDSHCKQNLDNCFHIYWSILFCFALGFFMQSNRNQKFLCIFHQLYQECTGKVFFRSFLCQSFNEHI